MSTPKMSTPIMYIPKMFLPIIPSVPNVYTQTVFCIKVLNKSIYKHEVELTRHDQIGFCLSDRLTNFISRFLLLVSQSAWMLIFILKMEKIELSDDIIKQAQNGCRFQGDTGLTYLHE